MFLHFHKNDTPMTFDDSEDFHQAIQKSEVENAQEKNLYEGTTRHIYNNQNRSSSALLILVRP